MPWLNQVPAVLEVWYPGQEDGIAVANLLFGVANPSGKLPITFPKAEHEGVTGSPEQFPGVMVDKTRTVTYTEKLEMGYRWYDAHKVEPQFPFGFGLSYTTFAITNLKVTKATDGVKPIRVQFAVQNTGHRAGSEVAQVYLSLPAATNEPPKRLIAFQKVLLAPGEKKTIDLTIDPQASNHPFSWWDTAAQKWSITGGLYQITVGNSSANMSLKDTITIRASTQSGSRDRR
jgi:beta-glucosidase